MPTLRVLQKLANFQRTEHREFHKLLRKSARGMGAPRSAPKRIGNRVASVLAGNPGSQVRMLRTTYHVSKQIDMQYGTNIGRQLVQNIKNGQFFRWTPPPRSLR